MGGCCSQKKQITNFDEGDIFKVTPEYIRQTADKTDLKALKLALPNDLNISRDYTPYVPSKDSIKTKPTSLEKTVEPLHPLLKEPRIAPVQPLNQLSLANVSPHQLVSVLPFIQNSIKKQQLQKQQRDMIMPKYVHEQIEKPGYIIILIFIFIIIIIICIIVNIFYL
jgi:hypothetical protein